MPLFKRKDKTTIAELEEYYAENNKQRRTGMAWFMAFLSLLITVLVIIGLFFAARWVYRAVTDDDTNDVGIASGIDQETTDASLPSFDTDELGGVGVSFGDGDSDNPDDAVEGDRTVASNGVVSDEAASTTRDEDADSTANTEDGDTTAVAGATDENELPETGAGEILVIAPLVAGVAGYAISRKQQLQ